MPGIVVLVVWGSEGRARDDGIGLPLILPMGTASLWLWAVSGDRPYLSTEHWHLVALMMAPLKPFLGQTHPPPPDPIFACSVGPLVCAAVTTPAVMMSDLYYPL